MCCPHIALLGEVTVAILSSMRWLVLVSVAGYGKTILVRENFDGSPVWDKSGLSGPSGKSHATKQKRQTKQTK